MIGSRSHRMTKASSSLSSSSLELSLLSTINSCASGVKCACACSAGPEPRRVLEDAAVASRDADRLFRSAEGREGPALRLRGTLGCGCAGDADLLAWPDALTLLPLDEALLDEREPATTVGRGSGGSDSIDDGSDMLLVWY